MDGTSNGSPEGIVPEVVQFILDWNPPQMEIGRHAVANLTQPPNNAARVGYTRQAAFYDKHLASHLLLERVVSLDALVSTMASTVDQAIQDLVTKNPIHRSAGLLSTVERIEAQVAWSEWTMFHESGVADAYSKHTSVYCLPIASTLAIHPSSRDWGSALVWTPDQTEARWAIADGVLRISTNVIKKDHMVQQLLQNEDIGMKEIITQLASGYTPLAIWEMKNLTVGTPQVMENIVEMGVHHAKFPWKTCTVTTPGGCNHHFWKGMEEARKNHNAGFDARSPPWTLLPDIPFTSATNSRPNPMRDGLRSASAQGGPSYREPFSSSMEGCEGFRNKRRRNGSNASEFDQSSSRKLDASINEDDESYEPPPGARKEVTAQSFIQQTWAEAARKKCTIMIMHSGNHEVIGIRHRGSQTLYISDLIKPHSSSNPAYGKIQVGIYIAAVQETRQDIEAEKNRSRDPSADIFLGNEEVNADGYHSPERPTRENKPSKGSRNKGKKRDRHEENERLSTTRFALLASARKQTHFCLRFFYDIYDSPFPATFRRITDEPKDADATGPAEPHTPPPSPGRETAQPSSLFLSGIHITVDSELQSGSTGIVHIGTMAVDQSGPTAKVAIKLAFSREENGVQGIPDDIGLFVDGELLLDAQGPYALLLSYAGVSFLKQPLDSVKYSVKHSLLATLRLIHGAGVLHGDIRLSNLCITPSSATFVVDFSHATEDPSQKEKDREIKDLAYILGIDLSTEPAAEDVQ